MKLFPEMKLSGLRDAFNYRHQERIARQDRSANILKTVERVVDGIDGRIRLVSSYRKKLYNVIADALDYTDSMIDRIPGAIEVSNRTFVSDPYVNAFFSNRLDVQSIFSRSSEIREFMENHAYTEITHCCALLCMHMERKTVLGVKLVGDTLKKDVKQTAVNFTDHRIYSPAPTERETRHGLKNCLFEGLVTNALERVVQLRLSNQRLQQERQILQSRLRRARYLQGKQSTRPATRDDCGREIEETRLRLEKTEEALRKIQQATPQVSLEQVLDVFGSPEKFVRLEKSSIRLDKMGITLDMTSSQPCNTLDLCVACIGEQPPRIVTLARFARDEFLSKPLASGQGTQISCVTM
jgi:hypothetical protein